MPSTHDASTSPVGHAIASAAASRAADGAVKTSPRPCRWAPAAAFEIIGGPGEQPVPVQVGGQEDGERFP
ncbi:hypothetical protein [Streptomyces sp. NPDC059144]|uniref:hypothetical protein n=1 Tax=Streptomyces sp. NPDC059144 TaxID=3346740 RepID=UPI0036A28E8F